MYGENGSLQLKCLIQIGIIYDPNPLPPDSGLTPRRNWNRICPYYSSYTRIIQLHSPKYFFLIF